MKNESDLKKDCADDAIRPLTLLVKTSDLGYSPIVSNINAPEHPGIDAWISGPATDSVNLQIDLKLTYPYPNLISSRVLSQSFFFYGDSMRIDDGLINECFRSMKITDVKNAELPQGRYRLEMVAIDRDSRKCLSNISSTTLIIRWFDPPQLRPPQLRNRNLIRFDWSTLPFELHNEYTLEIVKLTENDLNPAEAFVSDQAIFAGRTHASYLDVSRKFFKPHERCAARVIVTQSVRMDQLKNLGYSNIILFKGYD